MNTTQKPAPYWVLASTASVVECYIIDARNVEDAQATVRSRGHEPIAVELLAARQQARRNEILAAGDFGAMFDAGMVTWDDDDIAVVAS